MSKSETKTALTCEKSGARNVGADMNHGSLFSGIGGFDLAAEWMGWNNIFQVEIDGFCQKVLQKNFPNAKRYGDIKQFDGTSYRGTINVLSGGFPCQPYSTAGKRKGKEDERHLWPEMLRVVREVSPRWVVGENVRGLISWNEGVVFDEVQLNLEAEGYEVFPVVLPAAGVNAPHRRERIWFIAYSHNAPAERQREHGREVLPITTSEGYRLVRQYNAAYPFRSGLEKQQCFTGNDGAKQPAFERNADRWGGWPTQPPICGRNDGVSNRVDRIKTLGNAVVPQVVHQIFKAIEAYERINSRSDKEVQ